MYFAKSRGCHIEFSGGDVMVLFAQKGEENTVETLKIAVEELRRAKMDKLLISSTRGYSAKMALEIVPKEVKLIVVTHHFGFKEPNQDEFSPQIRNELLKHGHIVHTATHVLSGIERAFRREYSGIYTAEVIANTLRLFSQGVKVCVEISLMAADAGFVRTDEWVVACGGSSKGLDTAVVIKPANSSRMLDLRIGEILCMPSEYQSS